MLDRLLAIARNNNLRLVLTNPLPRHYTAALRGHHYSLVVIGSGRTSMGALATLHQKILDDFPELLKAGK